MKYMFGCLLALSLVGCVSKHVIPDSPAAAAALRADSAVIRVNELQAALIQACGPAVECQTGIGVTTAQFRDIIRGMISLRSTLKSTPEGWQATARTGWNQVKPLLAGITNPVIVAALSAVDAVIGAL